MAKRKRKMGRPRLKRSSKSTPSLRKYWREQKEKWPNKPYKKKTKAKKKRRKK